MKLYRMHKWCHDEVINEDTVNLSYTEYRVISETPKGYWVYLSYNKKKWTSKTAKSRFAYPTKEEAMNNFYYRCLSSISMMKQHIEYS